MEIEEIVDDQGGQQQTVDDQHLLNNICNLVASKSNQHLTTYVYYLKNRQLAQEDREKVETTMSEVKETLKSLSPSVDMQSLSDQADKLAEHVEGLRALHEKMLDNNNTTSRKELRALSELSGLFMQVLALKTDNTELCKTILAGNIEAFITKDTFRKIMGSNKKDYTDACHTIANNNGGPCHVHNLNMGSTGKNRSDQDKNDASNIYELSGMGESVGQKAIDAVWSCLMCQNLVHLKENVSKAVEMSGFQLNTRDDPKPGTSKDNEIIVLKNSGKTEKLNIHRCADTYLINYFPHSGENSYVKFLDSKLMKPFMDKLCEQLCEHLNKNKDKIVECILTNLESKPYKIEHRPEKKTSDYIIANWLFNIGKAKHEEHRAFLKAKTAYEDAYKEYTDKYTQELQPFIK